ncbi:hypothetical protein BMS3Bbin11_01509 [bacterium BMS3Bbin11]|nr:hypothetical protein BMS3Bbin11_01509 [bacterium BMS3Bbin11]
MLLCNDQHHTVAELFTVLPQLHKIFYERLDVKLRWGGHIQFMPRFKFFIDTVDQITELNSSNTDF